MSFLPATAVGGEQAFAPSYSPLYQATQERSDKEARAFEGTGYMYSSKNVMPI